MAIGVWQLAIGKMRPHGQSSSHCPLPIADCQSMACVPPVVSGIGSLALARCMALLLVSCSLVMSGCNIVGFFGAIEAERRRTGTIKVDAQYTGLEGQSVAVIVDASRDLQADGRGLIQAVLTEVIARLEANGKTKSIVPALQIERVLYDEPDLLGRTYDEIARRFGVDRLVVIQLEEFRLAEPGNLYVWAGLAAAELLVVEADSYIEDDVRFQAYVTVKYPTKDNTTIDDMPADAVALELLRRFANRTSWFFYRHDERYKEYQEY